MHQTPVYETDRVYACRERLEMKGNGKGFSIYKTILGRKIPKEQVEKLLTEKRTDLMEGFISKRTKKPFSAFLVLQDSGKWHFDFPPRKPRGKQPRKRR